MFMTSAPHVSEAPKPFGGLALRPETLRAINQMGWVDPTPIQSKVIPLMRDGRDLVGQAQTGSGKTGAYGIPLVERLAPAARGAQARPPGPPPPPAPPAPRG